MGLRLPMQCMIAGAGRFLAGCASLRCHKSASGNVSVVPARHQPTCPGSGFRCRRLVLNRRKSYGSGARPTRPVPTRAHFIAPDRLAGRFTRWHEMRLPAPVALAVLFHDPPAQAGYETASNHPGRELAVFRPAGMPYIGALAAGLDPSASVGPGRPPSAHPTSRLSPCLSASRAGARPRPVRRRLR